MAWFLLCRYLAMAMAIYLNPEMKYSYVMITFMPFGMFVLEVVEKIF